MAKGSIGIMGTVMRAIFGTDTRVRDAERKASDELLASVERKVARLDKALGDRPSRNLDEALRQTSGSDR